MFEIITHHLSISKIVLGRLRGIRGNSHNNAKANTIINNSLFTKNVVAVIM
jgi:hypothetical protein